uniref:Ovule protein n=1 Tax=Hydatigena taeniaeformis TaxID=6205 RepID=A0A0R3WJT6_HYDTA
LFFLNVCSRMWKPWTFANFLINGYSYGTALILSIGCLKNVVPWRSGTVVPH